MSASPAEARPASCLALRDKPANEKILPIAIAPKGDLGNPILTFPGSRPEARPPDLPGGSFFRKEGGALARPARSVPELREHLWESARTRLFGWSYAGDAGADRTLHDCKKVRPPSPHHDAMARDLPASYGLSGPGFPADRLS